MTYGVYNFKRLHHQLLHRVQRGLPDSTNVEESKTTVCSSVSSDLHYTITLLLVEAITLENEEENEIIQTYGLLDKDSEAFLIRDGV